MLPGVANLVRVTKKLKYFVIQCYVSWNDGMTDEYKTEKRKGRRGITQNIAHNKRK